MALVTAALVAGLNVHSFEAGRAAAAAGARPFAGCAWTTENHAVTDVLEAQAAQRAVVHSGVLYQQAPRLHASVRARLSRDPRNNNLLFDPLLASDQPCYSGQAC